MTTDTQPPPLHPRRFNLHHFRHVRAHGRWNLTTVSITALLLGLAIIAQFFILLSQHSLTSTTTTTHDEFVSVSGTSRHADGTKITRDTSATSVNVNVNVNVNDGTTTTSTKSKTSSDADAPYNISSHEPLNILFLYADDWRHDTLGAAGNPVIKTPHLDKLATKGVRFTHACVTTSICGISRATLQTGQYFSRHKSNPHNLTLGVPKYYDQKVWDERTLVGLLRRNGYFVGHVGKWQQNYKVPFKLIEDRFDYSHIYYEEHVLPNGNHVTAQNEMDAMEFLDKHAHAETAKDKPFFLNVAFFATHAEDNNPKQYIPQATSMDLYKNESVPVSPNADTKTKYGAKSMAQRSFERLPPFIKDQPDNESRARWKKRYETRGLFQMMMKNMYRMATEVDAVCGRLIAELERRGLYDNTLIVFTADNGNFHGEHGLADKWYPHEESLRVPLIIFDPRAPASVANTTNDEFVLNVDLAPTLLSAAGVKPPTDENNGMQGRDVAELYLNNNGSSTSTSTTAWRNEFYYEHPFINKEGFIPSSRALVRKNYKYFSWPQHKTNQLFDVSTDPYEENNLAADAGYAGIMKEMGTRLEELQQQVV